MVIKQKRPPKKFLLLALLILVIAGGLLGWQHWHGVSDQKPATTIKTPADEPVNYSGPTKQEKSETEQHKDQLAQQYQNEQSSTPAPSSTATPVIASYGQNPKNGNVEVGGFVEGVYEDGGTCTLKLEKDGQVVSGSKTAAKDATTTSCGVISINKSEVSRGTWSATITYTSPTATGTSKPVSVGVK